MFTRLFAETGLSLDRLRVLVEVQGAGSIARAAGTDPARQSQYSRQLKELEAFFGSRLVERQAKGLRLTARGAELGRISRFFLLALSNFHLDCRGRHAALSIAAGGTLIERLLLPSLLRRDATDRSVARFSVERGSPDEIEARLHELSLDFGLLGAHTPRSPLRTIDLGEQRLVLWLPGARVTQRAKHVKAARAGALPLVLALKELPTATSQWFSALDPEIVCDTFLEAQMAMTTRRLGGILPTPLKPGADAGEWTALPLPPAAHPVVRLQLAWNPRLLRLRPQVARQRDAVIRLLREELRREHA